MVPAGEQLELDLEFAEPAGLRASSRRAFSRIRSAVLDWTPVWVPLLVLAQLALGGLRPALAQSRRLDDAEASVHERVDRLHQERSRLDEDGERLQDPIYRERVRRSLRIPGEPPLTLDRARARIAEAARLEEEARGLDSGSELPGSGSPGSKP